MRDICLIYVGRCLPSNKVYVGSTTKGKKRILSHKRELNKGTHSNTHLLRSWRKYGEEAFTWVLVEECQENELLVREQWWISLLCASDSRYGFNQCDPVQGSSANRTHLALSQVETWKDPEIRGKRLTGLQQLHKDVEWKSRRAESMAKRWQDPEWRAKMVKVLATNVGNLQDRMANEPGFKDNRLRGIKRYQVPMNQRPARKPKPSNEIV